MQFLLWQAALRACAAQPWVLLRRIAMLQGNAVHAMLLLNKQHSVLSYKAPAQVRLRSLEPALPLSCKC
jgi:hypothetical protein